MTLTRSAFLLALAAALAGCTTPGDASAPLRVASYNIRLATGDKGTPNAWDLRKDDLIAQIRKMDLDAFGMQEVRPEQAAFLREKLPEFEFVGEHRGPDRKSDEASPVFFRKEIGRAHV